MHTHIKMHAHTLGFYLTLRRVARPQSETDALKFLPSFANGAHLATGVKAIYNQMEQLVAAIVLNPSQARGFADLSQYESENSSVSITCRLQL